MKIKQGMTQKIGFVKIINYRPMLFAFLAFLFGIVCSRRIFAGDALYISVVAVSFVLIMIACLLYKKWIPIVLIILSFFVGTGFYFLGTTRFYGKIYEGKQDVIARVTDVINDGDYYCNIVLDDCFIGEEKSKNIILSVKKDLDITIKNGDILSFNAYVNRVRLFELGKFNSYYLRNKTAYEVSINSSNLTTVTSGNIKFDEKVRKRIKDILHLNMSEESAGVAFAALTGDKTSLDSEVKNNFREAGIIHLLTVSGLHITFLIGLLSFVLRKCKVNKYVNFALIFAFLGFYCYICGFTPSVLRASIMGLILILAPILGKEYDRLTTLSVAGFLILLISPLSAFDLGFLMSFGSVGTIFMLTPPLEKIFKKFMPKYFAGAFAVSLSASLGVFPFYTYIGQDLNLLSVLTNVLIIPFFEILFILLFVSVYIAFIPFMGSVLKLADWGFYGINYVANFFASTKAKLSLKEFDILVNSLIFLMYFALSYFFMASRKVKAFVVSILVAVVSVYSLVINLKPQNYESMAYSITSFNNQSLFLTTSDGKVMFLGDAFSYFDERFLSINKIEQVDYVFGVGVNESEIPGFVKKAREFSPEKIVLCDFVGEYKEGVYASKNEASFVNEILFEYIYINSQCLGLKLDFDNISIFFASNNIMSYNNLSEIGQRLSGYSFDGAFLGKKYNYAYAIDSKINFGNYDAEKVSYSHLAYGNLCLNFKKKGVKSLD